MQYFCLRMMLWYVLSSAEQGGTLWVQPVCQEDSRTPMHVASCYLLIEIVIVEPVINIYFIVCVPETL